MRALNLLGVALGPEEDLGQPHEQDNPRGYWEPLWMLDLNDEILAKLGSVWWRPLEAPDGWEQSSDFDPLRERARRLLDAKFGASALWGWKEPRTTLTLPFWQELVPDARYVICLRNPADAIASIQRRPEPDLPIDSWADLWLEYTARALRQTRGRRRLIVFYEDFFRDSYEQTTRLASFLDLDSSIQTAASQRAAATIEEELRRHSSSPLELASTQSIPTAARAVFLALRAAQHTNRIYSTDHESEFVEAIAQIAPDLWTERRLQKHTQDTHRDDQRRAIALRRELQQLRGELRRTEADLSRTSTRCSAAQAALLEAQQQLNREQTLAAGLQSSLSWRITTPLRAGKRLLPRSRPA